MKFEKGDIVYWMGSDKAFGIVVGECEHFKGCYKLYVNGSYDTHTSCSGENLRHATHDEKELLLTALAKENKYYCEKTKTIKEMKKEFTKKDLKSGMWVELRNGARRLVLTDVNTIHYGEQDFALIGDNYFTISSSYNEDLTNKFSGGMSIDKVFCNKVDSDTYKGRELNVIWERETEEDKQIKEMQNRLSEMKKAYNDLEKNISETIDKLNGLKK